MARWVWDIAVSAALLVMFVLMVQSFSDKPVKGLTEIYYEDHTELPDVVEDSVEVRYIVRSLENGITSYRADTVAEVYIGQRNPLNITLDSTSFSLASGGISRFGGEYTIPAEFSRAKIRTTLVSDRTRQEIFFWVRSADYIMHYDGLGNGTVECLILDNRLLTLDRIEITASGPYAQGYPVMAVWLDGHKLGEYEVKDSIKQDVYIGAGEGTHYLDVAFINDYYNETTEDDRNLFIDQVFADQRPIRASIFDTGSGLAAFDCKGPARSLHSEGAARYKITVGDAR